MADNLLSNIETERAAMVVERVASRCEEDRLQGNLEKALVGKREAEEQLRKNESYSRGP